jgi:hypothetical protein
MVWPVGRTHIAPRAGRFAVRLHPAVWVGLWVDHVSSENGEQHQCWLAERASAEPMCHRDIDGIRGKQRSGVNEFLNRPRLLDRAEA